MIRTFQTHSIRKVEELSECLWDFYTMEDNHKDIHLQVPVPGCWETYAGYEKYRGKAVYTRSFHADGNVRLEFKGISHTAEVFVDDAKVRSHYNAYTPFEVIIKDLKKGEHELKVIVDNSFGEESALHIPNDYQSYGGISRGVVLEKLNHAYIRWIHLTPICSEEQWFIKVEVCLSNLKKEAFSGILKVMLDNDSMLEFPVQVAEDSEQIFIRNEIACPGVEAWSPENPKLYTVKSVLYGENGCPMDDLIDRTGFREVIIEGDRILLNGKKVRIKGFCRHEDHPQFGCALPYQAMHYDLMLMKDMGANSVRTTHYPNDEIFLDLCDELGMLVWEENHARGLTEDKMRNPNFERQCEDCIFEMIMNHYNHPSIYIWGILNECASDTEYGRECYEKQYRLIKELDSSRPHSSASCRFKTDICFDLPDIVSYNIYPQWYHDTPVDEYIDELYQWVQKETKGGGKPFLITEIGAGAIYGYRTPSRVKWSEEYQAEAVAKQLNNVLEYPGCSGVYIWQFCDNRVCDSWYNGRPRTMNNKGIVDEYRRPKLSYDTVKQIFGKYSNYE